MSVHLFLTASQSILTSLALIPGPGPYVISLCGMTFGCECYIMDHLTAMQSGESCANMSFTPSIPKASGNVLWRVLVGVFGGWSEGKDPCLSLVKVKLVL